LSLRAVCAKEIKKKPKGACVEGRGERAVAGPGQSNIPEQVTRGDGDVEEHIYSARKNRRKSGGRYREG